MTDQHSDMGEHAEEQAGNSPVDIPVNALFSYYRDDNKNTGGMQVKWTVRVAAGAEAARLDDRQNHAIRELLQWAHQHRRP
jgi:hypothetical protein